MSVLKLSKNDIIRNNDKDEKIKLKRSDLSFDSAMVSGWEQANRQSLDILNDYNNRINKSEWLDKEDRAKYRSALDSYIETSNLLRGINKTFGEGYSDEDEQKWNDSIASMNRAYDSTEKYYSQWIDEKDYKGQREGWLQASNLFDDGYQFGDILGTIAGSATDLVENLGAGIMGMGEAALDALLAVSPYIAQGQYYQNGGGFNLEADKAFDQSIETSKKGVSEFVAKDLYDEDAAAKAIIADPVKALTGIDAETDSVFGKKSDSLVQSAGQLGGTAALQAVGVPWWLTTGVTSFGGEAESALNQGATLNEAAFSGLVSAGAEILTEKISGGISFGGKTLDDVLPELTAKISNKVVRTIADLGVDMVGEGTEEVLSGVMSAIGQKLSYASDKEISELFSSEEALDSFIGGAVLGLGGSVIGNVREKISSNKQATEIYGNGAELVTEALEIDPNNSLAQKMQARLDNGKSLSGAQINRLVDVNEKAIRSNPTAFDNDFTTENTPEIENATESEISASETVENNVLEEGETVTLEDAATKYGAQAQAMVHTYVEGQDVAQYDKAYQVAYDMGKSGVSLSYVMNSKSASYLTEQQRELAYEAGQAAANISAKAQYDKIKNAATGKTGRRIGTVKGEGVTIADLKKTFNDTQNRAYKILTTAAEATGIDIVLYKSEVDAEGNFVGAQGKFNWSDDKIYIDINAGLKNVKSVDDLAKYAMVRSFSHEFTHFIEKYNSVWYNDFRKVVFETLTTRGENVNDLIEEKQAKNQGMTYDEASREVIAEAMTDILPDSHFVETLANKHKSVLEKLIEKLKDFLADVKAYFSSIGHNRSREANALKEQVDDAVRYVENIVKMFDEGAVNSVENYQMTVAFEEKAEKIDSTVTKKAENISNKAENKTKAEKTLFENYNEIKQKYPNNIVLYRVGDFFEVLGEDAKSVAEWTNATLTSRNDPNAGRVSMVGFPFNKIEAIVEKIRTHKDVTLVQEEGGVVKEYPMAPLKSSTNKDTDGGSINVTERKAKKQRDDKSDTRGDEGSSTEVGDGQGVSQEVRKVSKDDGQDTSPSERQRGVNSTEKEFSEDSFIRPSENSVEEAEGKILDEYGIEWYVVKKEEWNRKAPAFAKLGKVYMREGLEEEVRGGIARHEATHIMQQLKYKPYLDFVERTPEMLNMSSEAARDLIQWASKHSGVDVFDDESSLYRLYDEINASLYGDYYTEGAPAEYFELIPKAFNDYDQYIKDLAKIHEQFKAERRGVGEWSDVYERLRNPLSRLPRFSTGGFLFRIYKNGDTWQGLLDKVTESEGGYPVADAFGLKYRSEIYTNRADAVEDIIAVARNNKLLDPTNNEEVNKNGENVNNRSTVRQPDIDRQEDTPVLEGIQAEDVSGDAQGGDSLGDSVERGQQTVRDDVRPDAAGTRGR